METKRIVIDDSLSIEKIKTFINMACYNDKVEVYFIMDDEYCEVPYLHAYDDCSGSYTFKWDYYLGKNKFWDNNGHWYTLDELADILLGIYLDDYRS